MENSICKAPEAGGGLFDFFFQVIEGRPMCQSTDGGRRLAQGEVRDEAGAKSQRTW